MWVDLSPKALPEGAEVAEVTVVVVEAAGVGVATLPLGLVDYNLPQDIVNCSG